MDAKKPNEVRLSNELLEYLALTDEELGYIEDGKVVEFVRSLRSRKPMGLGDATGIWKSLRSGLGYE